VLDEVIYSDEMQPLRLVTKSYAQQHWSAKEMDDFDRYVHPPCCCLFY
jgi:hypothetical protein